MGIQPAWSKYEAAILLDQYLKVFSGEKNRSEAISFVSNILRCIAINNGLEIDGIYRNINGITFQMASMESAFLGRTVMKPATKLFEEIVSLYKSNYVDYKKLLGEAYSQCINKSLTRDMFANWLSTRVNQSILTGLYNAYEKVENYMFNMGVINTPLLEITNLEIIKKIQNIIKLDKGFRKAYKGKLVLTELAMQHFAEYLEESIIQAGTTKSVDIKRPEMKVDEAYKISNHHANLDECHDAQEQSTIKENIVETKSQEGFSALSNKIKAALEKECIGNIHGTTVGYIARSVGEKDKIAITDILNNAPWAKFKYGRWYFIPEKETSTISRNAENNGSMETKSSSCDESTDETAFEFLFLEWLQKNGEAEVMAKSYLSSLYSAEEYALSKNIQGISLTTLDYTLSLNSIEKMLSDKAFVRYDASLYKRYSRAFKKLKTFIDSISLEKKKQETTKKKAEERESIEESVRAVLEEHCKKKSFGASVASLQTKIPGISQSKIISVLKDASWAEYKNGVWFYKTSMAPDLIFTDYKRTQEEKIELVRAAFEKQCEKNPYGTTVKVLHSQLNGISTEEITSILEASDWAEYKYGTWNIRKTKKKDTKPGNAAINDETVKRIHDELKKQSQNNAYGTTIRRLQARLDGISEDTVRTVLEAADWAVFRYGTWDYKRPKTQNHVQAPNYTEAEKIELVRTKLMNYCDYNPNGATVSVLTANLIGITYEEIEGILNSADWAVFRFNSWKYIPPKNHEVHGENIELKTEANYSSEETNKTQELATQYNSVLTQYFEDGFRAKSAIDRNRFRMYFKELFGFDLQDDDSQIVTKLKSIGEVREDRIFAKNEANQINLIEVINDFVVTTFNQGASCIYLDCLFKRYREELAEKLHVYTVESMENILLGSGKRNYSKRYNYLFKFDIVPAANKDIVEYMKTSHVPVSYSEIETVLWYIPLDKIKYTLVTTPGIVNVAPESYLYAPNLPVSARELQQISDLIGKMLLQRSYISDVELIQLIEDHCPSVLMNTSGYPMWGLRNALAYLLQEKFSFRGAIISDKNEEISMAEVFADFCHRTERITVDALRNFANELNTVIYWDSVYDEMVRISQNEFVHRNQIRFNIEQTDDVLEKLIQSPYIPINAITLFLHFPVIDIPWNNFVLESYVANYSKKFRLLHASYSATECCGAIVRVDSGISDYRTLIVDVLANNPDWKDKKDALQLLVDLGYQQRRSYSDIEKVMQEAKAKLQTTKK